MQVKPSKLNQPSIPWKLPAGPASQKPVYTQKRKEIAHGTKEITEQKNRVRTRSAGAGTHHRQSSSSCGAVTRASEGDGGHGVDSP